MTTHIRFCRHFRQFFTEGGAFHGWLEVLTCEQAGLNGADTRRFFGWIQRPNQLLDAVLNYTGIDKQ